MTKKIYSFLLIHLGVVLIVAALPGLISAIKNFHSTNIVIFIIDVVILLGSLLPISIGLNLILNK